MSNDREALLDAMARGGMESRDAPLAMADLLEESGDALAASKLRHAVQDYTRSMLDRVLIMLRRKGCALCAQPLADRPCLACGGRGHVGADDAEMYRPFVPLSLLALTQGGEPPPRVTGFGVVLRQDGPQLALHDKDDRRGVDLLLGPVEKLSRMRVRYRPDLSAMGMDENLRRLKLGSEHVALRPTEVYLHGEGGIILDRNAFCSDNPTLRTLGFEINFNVGG